MQAGPAVVLTRERRDNEELAAALEARSVPVREIPCVSTRWVEPPGDQLRRLRSSERVDVLAFTSWRAVKGYLACLEGGARVPSQVSVAAVGERTARELEQVGMAPAIIASPPTGRDLAVAILDRWGAGVRVLIPGAARRAGDLEQVLVDAGATVQAVTVYENEAPEIPRLEPFEVAAVFVASPSAAERLLDAMPWMSRAHFVAIGPTTARALQELGVDSVETPAPEPGAWEEALTRAHRRLTGGAGA